MGVLRLALVAPEADPAGGCLTTHPVAATAQHRDGQNADLDVPSNVRYWG